jgi:hypothetical protein
MNTQGFYFLKDDKNRRGKAATGSQIDDWKIKGVVIDE